MHDFSVSRTTNGSVPTLSFDYVRSLDAGSWFGSGFGPEPRTGLLVGLGLLALLLVRPRGPASSSPR